MTILDVEHLLLRLGADALAVSAVGAVVIVVVRFAVLRPLRDFLDERLDAVNERLASVENELRFNGGTTMRDAVRRIEHKLDATRHDIDRARDHNRLFIATTYDALERAGVDVPDPEIFDWKDSSHDL
jgi:hypothetical protein